MGIKAEAMKRELIRAAMFLASALCLHHDAGAQARIDTSFRLDTTLHQYLLPNKTIRFSIVAGMSLSKVGKITLLEVFSIVDASGNALDNYITVTRYNSNGCFDRMLNDSGYVPVTNGNSLLFQGRGDTLYAGGGVGQIAVTRLKPNLETDSSFGIQGAGTSAMSTYSGPNNFCMDAKGRILAAFEGYFKFGIARFQNNGLPDSSFGYRGINYTLAGDFCGGAEDIAALPDGKILICGEGYTAQGGHDFALARYHENGSLDSSFGTNGLIFTDMGDSYDVPKSMAIQPDGRILVAGQSGYDLLAIARFMPDGSLDTSFNHTGKLRIDNNGLPLRGKKIILMKDGRILVGCAAYLTSSGKDQNMAVARILPDGRPDTAFAPGGVFTVDFGRDDWFGHIALQNDGGILIGGSSVDQSTPDGGQYRAFARIVVDGEDTVPPAVPPGQGFEVFPNPASGTVYIRRTETGIAGTAAIELLGINWQVVQRKEMERSEWMTSMDTKGLASGAYVLRIVTQDGNEQRVKLILK